MELPAGAAQPRYRARVHYRHPPHLHPDPSSLLVPVAAALPALPFVFWLAHIDPELLAARSVPSGQGIPLDRALHGAWIFLTGIPLVLLPWIVFVLAFAKRFQRQRVEPVSEAAAIRLALLTAGIGVALMAAMIVAVTLGGVALFGITRFAIHYLFPFCLFAALGVAGLVASRVTPDPVASALALASLIAAATIFLVKLGSFFVLPPRFEATNLIPYERLAAELTRRGLGHAQFVTLSPREAGNLAIYMPEARALSLSARIEPPPPDPLAHRPCVLLWGGGSSVPPAPATRGASRFLELLGIAANADAAEQVAVDWPQPLIGAKRRSVWHLLRGDAVEDSCRRWALTGVR